MTKRCGEKEGAPDEDVNAIIEMKPTNTHASKCIQACLADAGGIVRYIYRIWIKLISNTRKKSNSAYF